MVTESIMNNKRNQFSFTAIICRIELLFDFLKKPSVLFVLIFAIAYSSILSFSPKTYVEIHDNLDSVHAWLHMLVENNLFFSAPSVKTPLMDLERKYFLSPLQAQNFIYYLLSPFQAYVLTHFFRLLLGVVSFFLLTKEVLNLNKEDNSLVVLIGLGFSVLTGYENLYFAQASLPLVFWIYFKSLKNLRFMGFVIFYPLFSEFPRYGMFIILFISIYSVFLFMKKDNRWKKSILFLMLLFLGYVITEFHLFYTMLIDGEDTIRKSFNIPYDKGALETFASAFLSGQYHAGSSHKNVILPTFLMALFYIWLNRGDEWPRKHLSNMVFCLVLIVLSTLVYTLYYVTDIKVVLGEVIPPLQGWAFSRTIWFNPLLWSFLFLFSSLVLKPRFGRFVLILPLLHICNVVFSSTYGNDIKKTVKCNLKQCDSLSYDEFFSPNLFNEIKSEIGYKNQKSLAFGFHPSVLTYNNFRTADGYHNAYSLKYKYEFYSLISPALERSQKYHNYFLGWGGRAYLFNSKIDFGPKKFGGNSDNAIELLIDFAMAKQMGIKYVISLYLLQEVQSLKLEKVFQNEIYKIHVYEII